MADATNPKTTDSVSATPRTDTTKTPLNPNVKVDDPNKDKDVETVTNTGPETDVHGVYAIPAGTGTSGDAVDNPHPLHGDLGKAGGESEPDGPVIRFGPNGEVPRGDSGGRELITAENPFAEEVTGKE
jgi:hypothetical protein